VWLKDVAPRSDLADAKVVGREGSAEGPHLGVRQRTSDFSSRQFESERIQSSQVRRSAADVVDEALFLLQLGADRQA
jgi:hypothetical protein